VPQWAVFVGLTALVLTLLLALARLSQSAVRGDGDRGPDDVERQSVEETVRLAAEAGVADPSATDDLTLDGPSVDYPSVGFPPEPVSGDRETTGGHPDVADLTTGALLANVALTQGLFGGILLAGAWYTDIPIWAFGVTDDPLSTGLPALGIGIALGLGLYAVNEVGAASADAMGVEYDERLREMLAPDSARGWLLLLGVVLPIIAGVEEFIFRAAIIGATNAGFDTSPWALAVVSSLAFALGHGAQGRLGIIVTGGLGFVLAAAFILTGSFLVVFVAHYLVNALEFAVHELLGIDWAERR